MNVLRKPQKETFLSDTNDSDDRSLQESCFLQGNRIKNFEKIQVANFQMIAYRRLYSKLTYELKTMIDNQALTF
ncbi:hypothetical protein SJDPG2_08720 [Porphyromonas gingivalis SJD2]|nr:hypothetical protein SJDPG2_08720 [Porphyromonas gingivalis SJD2]